MLLALAGRAAHRGERELDLTGDVLALLEPTTEDGVTPPPLRPLPSLDLRARLHAADAAAVRAGRFRLVVDGAAPAAGATAGRFLHLLDDHDQHRWRAALRCAPTLVAGAVRAQVSSAPLDVAIAHLARAPLVTDRVIPIAEHPDDGPGVGRGEAEVLGGSDGLNWPRPDGHSWPHLRF